jgi:hypothetical protein
MPRRRDEHSPDLFAQRDEAAPREAVTPPVRASFLLPSNLDAGLQALDDKTLARLKDAVDREAQRRFPQPTAHVVAPPTPPPPIWTRKEMPPRPAKAASEPTIAIGKANMIRAAFKAGLKPAAIARQFRISPALVRSVLAGDDKEQ